MSEIRLQFEKISGGNLLKEVNAKMDEMEKDILLRPGNLGDRDLTIKIRYSHSYSAETEKVIPRVNSSVAMKLPPYKSDTTIGTFRKGKIHVSDEFPGELYQDSLLRQDEEGNHDD